MADLVLLDMNPLEDISHTRKIHAVVLGGMLYPLASIRAQALQDAATRQCKRPLAYRPLLGHGGHGMLFEDQSLASTVERSPL